MIQRLKELRTEKGISQQQLADVILASQQSVNKYENHGVEPDVATLIRIADYFEVSIDYLVGRTDVRTMPVESALSDECAVLCYYFQKLSQKQKDCVMTVVKSYFE